MSHYWIDTDIALGATSGDVDDGWAIAAFLMALTRSHVKKLEGVSICAGNAGTAMAFTCATALLRAMNRESIRVMHAEDAGRAMAGLQDGCTILALGPLTNVAAALTIDPHLGTRVRLAVVGGVINPRRWRRRLSDLNFRRDRAAVARVFQAFADIRQYPLDVVDQLVLSRERMERVATMGALGAYLARHSARWMRRAHFSHGTGAFPLWDLVPALDAVGLLVRPRFDEEQRLVSFDADATWAQVESLFQDSPDVAPVMPS
jgi:inosine-uridine nucleoside N-ribohydrolase